MKRIQERHQTDAGPNKRGKCNTYSSRYERKKKEKEIDAKQGNETNKTKVNHQPTLAKHTKKVLMHPLSAAAFQPRERKKEGRKETSAEQCGTNATQVQQRERYPHTY